MTIKLLLDANISWRLAGRLKAHFDDCIHVDFIGLAMRPSDIGIWNCSLANHFIIVNNDENFMHLLNTKGFPPKIILLKTGNQSNQYIEGLIIKHKIHITQLAQSEEYGMIEIY